MSNLKNQDMTMGSILSMFFNSLELLNPTLMQYIHECNYNLHSFVLMTFPFLSHIPCILIHSYSKDTQFVGVLCLIVTLNLTKA
jgi:hypothetical protein